MFEKNKKKGIAFHVMVPKLEEMKRSPLAFFKEFFGEDMGPVSMPIDFGSRCPRHADIEAHKSKRMMKDVAEAVVEDVEEEVEDIEDRLNAMQAFLKLEYVKEEVTDDDGFTSVERFMRKKKA